MAQGRSGGQRWWPLGAAPRPPGGDRKEVKGAARPEGCSWRRKVERGRLGMLGFERMLLRELWPWCGNGAWEKKSGASGGLQEGEEPKRGSRDLGRLLVGEGEPRKTSGLSGAPRARRPRVPEPPWSLAGVVEGVKDALRRSGTRCQGGGRAAEGEEGAEHQFCTLEWWSPRAPVSTGSKWPAKHVQHLRHTRRRVTLEFGSI